MDDKYSRCGRTRVVKADTLTLQRIISAIRIVCNWNKLPDSIVATDTIVRLKKALRTINFETALTFNRHS